MNGITKSIGIIALVTGAATWLVFPKERNSIFLPRKAYNLLLISIDTCRADFVGTYGNPAVSTPNIDSLARNGVLMENHYSTINTTLAAHSSMFTGLYPRNHGVAQNGMRLNPSNLTMAEIFRDHGYATAAFIGSFSLASVFGINQGFEDFDDEGIGKLYFYKVERAENRKGAKLEFIPNWSDVNGYRRSAEDVNKSFFQWLDRNKEKGFFAFVHYYDAHFPYISPEKWWSKRLQRMPSFLQEKNPFAPIIKDFNGYAATPNAKTVLSVGDFEDPVFPESAVSMLQLYKSAIEYCDFAVGEVIKKLKQENLLSKTIVVVTSDHGETLIEHPGFDYYFNHGLLTYESETHIPCIYYCPNLLPQGKRVHLLSSQVDMLPTLAEGLRFKIPSSGDGFSYWKQLTTDSKTRRVIFSEASKPHSELDTAVDDVWLNDQNSVSIRSADYEYIRIPWEKYEGFFNISKDPMERNNLLSEWRKTRSSAIAAFQRKLVLWQSKASAGAVDRSFQLTNEDREKLKSLGYLNY